MAADEFDIIFSNAALHWVLDHSLLLEHAFYALKKGGRIHCTALVEKASQVSFLL